MSIKTVTLEHIGTKERHVLEVESFTQGRISVRWGMSGIYDLDLLNNTIQARNLATRRKHPNAMGFWRIVDIDDLRKAVWKHFHPKDDSFERHVQNMPYRAKMLGNNDGKSKRRA